MTLFYNNLEQEILADYRDFVKLLFKSFAALGENDAALGKGGTVVEMRAVGQAVELQAAYVRAAIEALEIGGDEE